MALDIRKWLLIVHSISLVIAAGGGLYGWFKLPTSDSATDWPPSPTMDIEKPFLVAYMATSALLSVTLLAAGALSPALHQESSVVVHSSLMLCFLHLDGYSFSLSRDVSEKSYSGSVVFTSLHMMLLLISALQVALSSYDLRARGNAWPRGKLMQLFTLGTPVIGVRMGVAVSCSISASNLAHYHPEESPAYYTSILLTGALHNIFTTCEGVMSLYWGIPHHMWMGVNGFITGALLGVSVLLATMHSTDTPSPAGSSSSTAWVSEAALVAVGHGFLCLARPALTTVPTVFLRLHQAAGPVEVREDESFGTRRRASSSSDAGLDAPLSQYGRFYSVESSNQDGGAAEEATTGRLAIPQLFKTTSFFRNFVFCVVSGLVVVLGSTAALQQSRRWDVTWSGSVLLVTSGACLCLRTLPPVLVALNTRRPVADPAPRQVAACVILESILAITGCFLSIVSGGLQIAAAIATLLLTVLQFLHVNGIVRTQKILATASS